ncbi:MULTISPECIES: nucleotidyltransferase family protein [unclassified Leisingera]|uniref:nucleotidyltransferase family protein n=1 Tax=unclassified Leisingera TaxID=2614906 RepID=UPI0002FD9C24|nr:MULTISPECIES: nucleotidyltransferase family protein [unclassified Leisingera]KIC26600.1 4-diphosphocytidyl-2C-methyl-D-erythritol synthase [Leisingera sp. ANG-S3]KIC53827.1 4-diphosphocytidyl-2C-methyl-D-erythritol synthase [Leisingera sp. ANG-S]KID10316.1 4-diphosphocytidyl-2C-methyl-D-erythritol synthase [Leisingera sp. ANG1]
MTAIAILLLAAGASSRMQGRDKLMEEVDGQPLLTLMCRRAALTGLPVYVTLPGPSHPRAAATGDATQVPVPDAAEGMSASIRRGTAALLDGTQAVMILPADMPEITAQDMLHLAAHFGGPDSPVLRATAEDGTPGHPVLFPRRCFEVLQCLQGDQGARSILTAETVRTVPLPGRHALTDLDTPEDWAAWRQQR